MPSLSIRPSAKDDIQGIVDYYDDILPKITDNFLSELDIAINYIQKSPSGNQKRLGNIRAIFLKRFSYGVYYKVYKTKVVIIAVLHTSRNPQIWKSR